MPAFILRADRGRLSIHRAADGKSEWHTDKFSMRHAEAEASRARFRDDKAAYCVYGAGLFRDGQEIAEFVRLVNGGASWDAACTRIQRARVDVAA